MERKTSKVLDDRSPKRRKIEEILGEEISIFPDQTVRLSGSAKIEVIQGSVCVNGYYMKEKESYSTYSPHWHPLDIFAKKHSIIQIHPISSKKSEVTTLKKSVNREGCEEILKLILSDKSRKTVICGPRNAGKSTIGRFLINSLLNRVPKVAFLETDVGQCEFTPVGFVSLSVLSKPIFGPPHTHQRIPHSSFYFGDSSPSPNPAQYIECVREAFTAYKKLPEKMPLIVNTNGWITGLGMNLLGEIVEIISPDLNVEIVRPKEGNDLENHKILRKIPTGCEVLRLKAIEFDTSLGWTGFTHRKFGLATYFSQSVSLERASFRTVAPTLCCQRPYRVPFSKICVQFLHNEVKDELSLMALNAVIVSLAIAPSLIKGRTRVGRLRLVPEDISRLPSVGLGIIRTIDLEKEEFYVITPVSFDILKKVNVFQRGKTDLPAEFISSGCSLAGNPYFVNDYMNEPLMGTRPMRSRHSN